MTLKYRVRFLIEYPLSHVAAATEIVKSFHLFVLLVSPLAKASRAH
jgi:hypothetical protein